jgi:hypothetical protein
VGRETAVSLSLNSAQAPYQDQVFGFLVGVKVGSGVAVNRTVGDGKGVTVGTMGVLVGFCVAVGAGVLVGLVAVAGTGVSLGLVVGNGVALGD